MNKTVLTLIVLCLCANFVRAQDDLLQFVFTSDVHYGLTRPHFRGADSVASAVVNRAMIRAINGMPDRALPSDGGVGAGRRVGHVDGLMITGDIANRQETGIQASSVSWAEFESDYFKRLTTRDGFGRTTPVCVVAGNHDLADAIGSWRAMEPLRDAGSMAGLYNRMPGGAHALSAAEFDVRRDIVHYSRDWKGVHCLFVNLWPDSAQREWMDHDLAGVPAGTPVLLFTHAEPDGEARFFINPNGDHSVNERDKFENLLPEVFHDGDSVGMEAVIEQRALAAFIKKHPAIKAWFHGHNNWTEFYVWKGPDKDLHLPVFRVDSPMKGKYSRKNEKALSFELITIDPHTLRMTVRECLWNEAPLGERDEVGFRVVKTIGLRGSIGSVSIGLSGSR